MADFIITSQALTATTALTRAAGAPDAVGFEAMEEEFGKLLDSGVSGIVLEISGLENLSSAALGAMLNLDMLVRARKGLLVVTGMSEDNAGLLEMLGLNETFTQAESTDAARKMIAAIK